MKEKLNKKETKDKTEKGFTLIELLAVIVIMGILMMVAIPAMMKYINDSRKKTYMNTVEQYVNAVKIAYAAGKLTCSGDEGPSYISFEEAKKLLESGGDSPYTGGGNLIGYIRISTNILGNEEYAVAVRDGKGNGFNNENYSPMITSNIITNAKTPNTPTNASQCTVIR